MTRVVIKGGVWKNIEDEILKAAVMKYGLNQWARISSLLVKKSAKQCKARWFEWLDPNIKKTEWTREEEEKLLHLAKIMPTQWRTIAPLVGRTATQCMEHYEKLLDAAQGLDDEQQQQQSAAAAASSSTQTGRAARRGVRREVDAFPESRPARPDAVDMDEEDKEMLNEARARLANTLGKKAKRKAREKQMEEAKRLAQLQKRRELRAAGISTRLRLMGKKDRGQMDLLHEVPYEHRAQPGFYDTADEDARALADAQNRRFRVTRVENLEGKSFREQEEERRRDDAAAAKRRKETDLPAHLLKVSQINDVDMFRKRTKLSMPAPQLTEDELSETVKAAIAQQVQLGSAANSSLLTPGMTPLQTPLMTPMRTPMRAVDGLDRVMREAQNLVAMEESATPLVGGINPHLHRSNFATAMPTREVAATPNLLVAAVGATPGRGGGATVAGAGAGATPAGGRTAQLQAQFGAGLTPAGTPLRDALGINRAAAGVPSVAETPADVREIRRKEASVRQQLKSGLSSLPQPQNEYQTAVAPDDDDGADGDGDQRVRDQSDVDAELARLHRQRALEAEQLQTQVVRRGLPRPLHATRVPRYSVPKEYEAAHRLIEAEFAALLRNDAKQHPLPGVTTPDDDVALAPVTLQQLEAARRVLATECAVVRRAMGHENASAAVYAGEMDKLESSTVFGLVHTAAAKTKEHVDTLRAQWQTVSDAVQAAVARSDKIEKKLTVTHGGYVGRANTLAGTSAELVAALAQAHRELATFRVLAEREEAALPRRIGELRSAVAAQKTVEAALQRRYAALTLRRDVVARALESSG